MTLAHTGILPVRRGPVRFAVGPPDGMTSNSWTFYATKNQNVYISCRDNFKEAKVSLHASGRWRMGFTEDAIRKNPNLVLPEQNRAWEVWDKPPDTLPNTTVAFRLAFPTSELAVRPEQRAPEQWRKVFYVEAAPPGKLAMLTVFVTIGDLALTHESEPSFCLASLDIGNNQRAQLIVHGEPEGTIPAVIECGVIEARNKMEAAGKLIPAGAYIYLLGRLDDGSRYLVGARANR
jgi:hypothetical protein